MEIIRICLFRQSSSTAPARPDTYTSQIIWFILTTVHYQTTPRCLDDVCMEAISHQPPPVSLTYSRCERWRFSITPASSPKFVQSLSSHTDWQLPALWEILYSSSQPPTISTSQSYAPPLSLLYVLVVTLYCQHSSVRPVVLLLPSLAEDHSQNRVSQHLLSFLQFSHHLWLITLAPLIIVDIYRIIVVIFTYKSAMCGLKCGGE